MLVAAHLAFAQPLQGVITYELKVNLHKRLPPEREDMKKMIPEFRSSSEQLFFNETESLHKPLIEDDPDEFDNGGGMHIKMARPYYEFYLNSEDKQVISKKEFMGKNYLVTSQLEFAPWKFSDETKTIQGYECKQAYYTNEETKQAITAWFTNEIRPFLGPTTYNTLPGAVLAVDINNEEQVFIATKIEFRELKKNELKIPKGGEEIAQEDFRKMVDEKMKEMGGGPRIMIRN
jgi:GLPGLI family protein